MSAHRAPAVARTPPSAKTGAPGRYATKSARAGTPGGSHPAATTKHEPTEYERAAERAYAGGRREQRCPDCGREEAGGGYCTGCHRPVHPDDWTNDTAKARAGRTAAAARRPRT